MLFAEGNGLLLSPSAVKLKILYTPCDQNQTCLGSVMCIYGKTSFVSCFASLNTIIFHWTWVCFCGVSLLALPNN